MNKGEIIFVRINLHSNIFKLIHNCYFLLVIVTVYLHSNIFKLIQHYINLLDFLREHLHSNIFKLILIKLIKNGRII